MDHRVTEKAEDLQSNSHDPEIPNLGPLPPSNCRSDPSSCPEHPKQQSSATGITIYPENACNLRGHASLSSVRTSGGEAYGGLTSPADSLPTNEDLQLVRDRCPLGQAVVHSELRGSSSESSSTSDTITQSAPAVLGPAQPTVSHGIPLFLAIILITV